MSLEIECPHVRIDHEKFVWNRKSPTALYYFITLIFNFVHRKTFPNVLQLTQQFTWLCNIYKLLTQIISLKWTPAYSMISKYFVEKTNHWFRIRYIYLVSVLFTIMSEFKTNQFTVRRNPLKIPTNLGQNNCPLNMFRFDLNANFHRNITFSELNQ